MLSILSLNMVTPIRPLKRALALARCQMMVVVLVLRNATESCIELGSHTLPAPWMEVRSACFSSTASPFSILPLAFLSASSALKSSLARGETGLFEMKCINGMSPTDLLVEIGCISRSTIVPTRPAPTRTRAPVPRCC